MNLIVEFSELSGNSQIQETNHAMREIYLLRAQIEGIRLATSLIQINPEQSMEYFASIGLRLSPTDPLEKVIKRIKGFAANKIRQYNKAQEKYNSLSSEKGDKITEQHFNEQLAALSKHNGFRITKTIALAEYAAYLKEYSQFINRQEWQRMKV